MNKIVMIIALALVFNVNANAKTNWIMENSYFGDTGSAAMDYREILFNGIGEDGRKSLEMRDCEHQQNLQRKKPTWPLSDGKWDDSYLILYEN